MEFTPITTQEELDKIISARLTREREAVAKKYADYDDLKARQAEHDKTVADLTARVKRYETDSVKTRIALESGLPYEMAARLSGENEDEIRADAQALAKFVGKPTPPAPRRSTEPAGESGEHAAFREMLHSLKGDS